MSGSTVYYVAQSLDGFIADRDAALEWLLAFGFEDFQQQYDTFLAGIGAVLMGAGTYRWLAAQGEAWAYTGTPCWVLSSGELPPIDGAADADITVVDDMRAAVDDARAAAGGHDVWVVGGGSTAASLADAGLLDRLHLTVMPITLGAGTRVLPHTLASIRWHLESAQPIGSAGAVELRYRVRSS
ncbi:dihydrofolate reductase family protein [Microcella sp.]|uniref:dihydrofolate reductase family protein n=1 Tax=Microcella sp. TaxID=1913979 RepID=UPI0025690919|nr:dihydrofolate reductase family protein [Microcella sp.]MBX9470915.1 dihydrofolate reductase family protein [Microcella sp.]